MTNTYDDQFAPDQPAGAPRRDAQPPSGPAGTRQAGARPAGASAAPAGSASAASAPAGSAPGTAALHEDHPSGPMPIVPVAAGGPAAGANPGTTGDQATAPSHPPAGFDDRGRVKGGKAGALWAGLISGAIFLILLIVFIAQNSTPYPIHFLGFKGHLALGLTVLLAAVVGLLLAGIAGTVRIVQLRKALKLNVPRDQRGR